MLVRIADKTYITTELRTINYNGKICKEVLIEEQLSDCKFYLGKICVPLKKSVKEAVIENITGS